MNLWLPFVSALLMAPAPQPSANVRILIAYDSRTGNTAAMGAAVRDGAASVAGAEVVLRKISEVKDQEISTADGLIIGTPVHWSNLSIDTKRFIDRAGEVLGLGKAGSTFGEGRTAGVFCTAGGPAGGQDLVRSSILSALLAMRFVIIGGVSGDGFGSLGPQAVTLGQPPGVSEKDLADARRFGERFARLTLQFRAGAERRP